MNNTSNQNLHLSAPWHTYRNMLAHMFSLDEDITVGNITGEGDALSLRIDVLNNRGKCEALNQLLKKTVAFGSVTLTISVENSFSNSDSAADIAKTALAYNRLVKDIVVKKDMTGTDHTFVVFYPEVIQFFNDDLTDYCGNFNALAEDVAREIFNTDICANYCTADLRENSAT